MITKVLSYACIFLLLCTLGSLVFGFYERSEVSVYKSASKEYKGANQTNLNTIKQLQDTNNSLIARIAVDSKKQELLAQQVEEAKKQTANTFKQNEQKIKVIYATNPQANQWANTIVPNDIIIGLCRGTCGQDSGSTR